MDLIIFREHSFTMKKYYYVFVTALSLISTCAIASLPHYYIAADAGIFKGEFNNNYTDKTDVIPLNITQPVMQNGYTVGAKLGFNSPCTQQIFLGGELALHVEGHNASFQTGSTATVLSDNTQVEANLDLTFVPSLMLTRTVAGYLKIGASLAYIQDTLSSPVSYTAVMQRYTSYKFAPGFSAGLGLTKSITRCTSIYAEANYDDYGTVNFSGFQNFLTTYAHSAHVYTYNIVVGMAYHFN